MKTQPAHELTVLQLRSEIEQMMGYLNTTESGLLGCPDGIKFHDRREYMYVFYVPEEGKLYYRAWNHRCNSGNPCDEIKILINNPEIEKQWLVKLHGSLQCSAWNKAEREALADATRIRFIYQMGFQPR